MVQMPLHSFLKGRGLLRSSTFLPRNYHHLTGVATLVTQKHPRLREVESKHDRDMNRPPSSTRLGGLSAPTQKSWKVDQQLEWMKLLEQMLGLTKKPPTQNLFDHIQGQKKVTAILEGPTTPNQVLVLNVEHRLSQYGTNARCNQKLHPTVQLRATTLTKFGRGNFIPAAQRQLNT